MKIILNGKELETQENTSILGLLKLQNVKTPEMVSVELNGDILEQTAFEQTTLKENDHVEFLFFMGGGAW